MVRGFCAVLSLVIGMCVQCVCVCGDSLLVAFSGLQSECGDDGGVVWHDEAY